MTDGLLVTALPLPLVRRGKVRDVYRVDADRLLLVTTDRISAFDVVMHEAIPYKGVVLRKIQYRFARAGRRFISRIFCTC